MLEPLRQEVQRVIKTCARCGLRFGCGHGEPGCWCEAVLLRPETLAAIRAVSVDCLCPTCLAAFAEKEGATENPAKTDVQKRSAPSWARPDWTRLDHRIGALTPALSPHIQSAARRRRSHPLAGARPTCDSRRPGRRHAGDRRLSLPGSVPQSTRRPISARGCGRGGPRDRKSTRLNSSHVAISYAVFCLKKKKKQYNILLFKKKKKKIKKIHKQKKIK